MKLVRANTARVLSDQTFVLNSIWNHISGYITTNGSFSFGLGCTVIFLAVLLAVTDVISSTRYFKIYHLLDKVWFTARVRSILRGSVVLQWLAFAVGYAEAATIFVAFVITHLSASYIRYCLEYMSSRSLVKPVANLKSKTSFDKVWKNLPAYKKKRTKLLYGTDVWFTTLLLAILGVGSTLGVDSVWVTAISFGSVVVGTLALVLATARTSRRRSQFAKANVPAKIQKKVIKEIKAFKPEVIVYFSGAKSDRYQLEQWLDPVNKLKKKTLIVLRENCNAAKFPPCKWPVVVARTPNELESVTVASVKTALYVSNAAKNTHLLRNGSIKHVHLNHGDSDKASSANPYCRVYDALFVAGDAGIRRYKDIGFDGKKPKIVKVGRPQLQKLCADKSKKRNPNGLPTVLYAPTWEGVADSVNYSSIANLGAELGREAAASKTINLLVKAHPNTGRYSPAAAQALVEISEIAKKSDHVTLMGVGSDLLSCFKEADVLISDVSAVVSDYLFVDRPIVMTRPTSVPAKDFKAQFPLSAAATVVANSDGAGAFQAALSSLHTDQMAGARHKKILDVHGKHPKGPQATFDTAVAGMVSGKLLQPKPKPKPKAASQKPLKVLLTLHRLDVGGAERDCIELSSALTKRGHKVSVFAQDGVLRSSLDSKVTFIERPSGRLKAARAIARIANDFDVINTHNLQSLIGLSGSRTKAPILATIHNIGSHKNDAMARKLLRSVPDEVVFVSEAERNRLFPTTPKLGTVVRPGIGVSASLKKLQSSKDVDENVVLFCGRLSIERGPDFVLRAMPYLPQLRLKIVGKGPMEQELRNLAQDLGVTEQVEFLGAVKDPYPHIAGAAVVAVPSRRDALPRIVREAASLAKPIVASNVDGIKESAGEYESVRYCDPLDARLLAQTLIEAIASQGETTKAAHLKPSSWSPMVETIERLNGEYRKQRPRERSEKDQAHKRDVAKAIENSDGKAEYRYFDGVYEIVGKQKQDVADASGLRRWQNQRADAQASQEDGYEELITNEPVRHWVSDAERSLVHLEETNRTPRYGEGDPRFDQEVAAEIKFLTEARSEVTPPGQLPVDTVSHQVQLGGHKRHDGVADIAEPDEQRRDCASDGHQEGEEMLVGSDFTELPREERRNLPAVHSASPVLTSSGSRQGFMPELSEADLIGTAEVHQSNTTTNEVVEVDINEHVHES